MTYEYFIKRKPTEANLKLQRPVIWEPCDLSLRISKNFKCAKKTAIKIFNEFVKCSSSGYIYSLCQDKGCGFSEIKKSGKQALRSARIDLAQSGTTCLPDSCRFSADYNSLANLTARHRAHDDSQPNSAPSAACG